jgi:alpha-tubulin suppressor-like RCC1 family protein
MIYENKYFKYKNKYLNLKIQFAGTVDSDMKLILFKENNERGPGKHINLDLNLAKYSLYLNYIVSKSFGYDYRRVQYKFFKRTGNDMSIELIDGDIIDEKTVIEYNMILPKFDLVHSSGRYFTILNDDGTLILLSKIDGLDNRLEDYHFPLNRPTPHIYVEQSNWDYLIQSNIVNKLSRTNDIFAKDVTKIFTSRYLSVGIKGNGTIFMWGANVPVNIYKLINEIKDKLDIKNVYSIDQDSYAILYGNGSVITWGKYNPPKNLVDIKLLSCNGHAFAAATHSGDLIAWGDPYRGGGKIPIGKKESCNMLKIYCIDNGRSFAALNSEGIVVTWGFGYGKAGPICTPGGWLSKSLSRSIDSIAAGTDAYVLLTYEGNIQGWGFDVTIPEECKSNVKQVIANELYFIAIKKDNSIYAWRYGQVDFRNADRVQETYIISNTIPIKKIVTTKTAFAILKHDGSVITNGFYEYGWISDSVQAQLVYVFDIYSTDHAFAALRYDGSVITWGNPLYGGEKGPKGRDLGSNVYTIHSTQHAFIAIKKDKSIISWGHEGI